jgi:hypothetical protein
VAGLSAKKELSGETSAVRQVASDESPTVWIKDTPPVALPVGRGGREGCMSVLKGMRYETNRPLESSMVKTNWAALFNGNLSRVYFPVLVVGSKAESGILIMVGGASSGRTSKIKGGPVVMFEPPQLTVNGPHCVGGE